MLYERCREEVLLFDKARLNLSNLSLQDLNVPVDFVCNVDALNAVKSSLCLHWPSSIAPILSLTIISTRRCRCPFCSVGTSCWRIFGTESTWISIGIKRKRPIWPIWHCRPTIWSLLWFISWSNRSHIASVSCRNLSSSLPVHLVLVDAFTPCELSCSVLGYAFGVMETAVNWILKNGAKESWIVCLMKWWIPVDWIVRGVERRATGVGEIYLIVWMFRDVMLRKIRNENWKLEKKTKYNHLFNKYEGITPCSIDIAWNG